MHEKMISLNPYMGDENSHREAGTAANESLFKKLQMEMTKKESEIAQLKKLCL